MPKNMKLGKIAPKKKNLSYSMGYTAEALQIMNCWEDNGGKIPKKLGTKVLKQVMDTIDELITQNYNTYECIERSPEIRFKKWTVNEIIRCINFYAIKLHKSISKITFPEFVLVTTNKYARQSQNARKIKDYSLLIESFNDLQTEHASEKSDHLRNQLIRFNNNGSIPEKVFIRTAAWLDELDERHVINPSLSMDSIQKMFIRYVKLNLSSNPTWKMGYMAGESFQTDFLNLNLRCNAIITKKTLAQWERKEEMLYGHWVEHEHKRNQEEFTPADMV